RRSFRDRDPPCLARTGIRPSGAVVRAEMGAASRRPPGLAAGGVGQRRRVRSLPLARLQRGLPLSLPPAGKPAAVSPEPRPILLVAACALVDVDGRVLIAKRPETKAMAGLWEFPGGKVEPGEPP